MVIAHRGASARAPENTLSAFRLARRLGAAMVELDLRQTKDRRLVVIHDPTLARTAGVARAVGDLTLSEIQALDAGAWFSRRFAGERVPTLHDVLNALGPTMAVNIELKSGGPASPGMEARLVALLRRRGWLRRTLVSSFDAARLEKIRRAHPRIAIGILLSPWSLPAALARARRFAAISIHPPLREVTPTLVRRIHDEGLLIFPYTVDRPVDKARLLRWGVDGFFTNRPRSGPDGAQPS